MRTRFEQWRSGYSTWRDSIDPVLSVIYQARFAMLMSVVLSLLLTLPPQAIDAVRVLAEDGRWWPVAVFWIGATLVCAYLWGSARAVRVLLRSHAGELARISPRVSEHIARGFGVLPLVAIAAACGQAIRITGAGEAPPLLWVFVGLGFAGAIALHFLFGLQERWLGRHESETGVLRRVVRTGCVIAMAASVLLSLVFAIDRGASSRAFGPFYSIFMSAMGWTVAGSVLVYWGSRWRLPLLLFAVGLALAWSALDWNDNHALRRLPTPSATEPRTLPDISTTFERWLDARADKDEYAVYPVFVVSAEGGGLYAAYYSAMVLSALQDQEPAFARHLFAASGVSGGSLGVAVFSALASQEAHNRTHAQDSRAVSDFEFKAAADRILSRDFLSPMLALGLFPDTLQRFLPFPVPIFSRARALEEGFEWAWRREAERHDGWTQDLFARSFYNLWPSFEQGATPALLLNTTEVSTGQRMVITNLFPDNPLYSDGQLRTERDTHNITTLAKLAPALDLRLSTAVGLSARFPFITPAGSITSTVEGRTTKRRFVDGGYYDNSGAATMADVLLSMHAVGHEDTDDSQHEHQKPYKLIWIHIGFIDRSADRPGGSLHTWKGLGELLSPLRALLNTRSGRTGSSVRDLRLTTAQLKEHRGETESIEFVLDLDASGPPLGWLLSAASRKTMEDSIENSFNAESRETILEFLRPKHPAPGQPTTR